MWYEILPSAGIVFALLYVPAWTHWAVNKIALKGKAARRDWEGGQFMDWQTYLRDRRITGSEYKPRGLESIPDDN